MIEIDEFEDILRHLLKLPPLSCTDLLAHGVFVNWHACLCAVFFGQRKETELEPNRAT